VENCKKKPLILVAFFTFLIAAFFAAEQVGRSHCPVHKAEQAKHEAKKHLSCFRHKAVAPLLCGVKFAKKAKHHAFHLVDDLSERLHF